MFKFEVFMSHPGRWVGQCVAWEQLQDGTLLQQVEYRTPCYPCPFLAMNDLICRYCAVRVVADVGCAPSLN